MPATTVSGAVAGLSAVRLKQAHFSRSRRGGELVRRNRPEGGLSEAAILTATGLAARRSRAAEVASS